MIQYTPSKHAFYTEGPSLTEQEHKDSCDINIMIKNAHRGMNIRGGSTPQYGYDDTTMDALQFRIQKEKLESELSNVPKEFEQHELDLIPEPIKQKFGYKLRKNPKNAPNDDQTTKNANPPLPTDPPPKTEPT